MIDFRSTAGMVCLSRGMRKLMPRRQKKRARFHLIRAQFRQIS